MNRATEKTRSKLARQYDETLTIIQRFQIDHVVAAETKTDSSNCIELFREFIFLLSYVTNQMFLNVDMNEARSTKKPLQICYRDKAAEHLNFYAQNQKIMKDRKR